MLTFGLTAYDTNYMNDSTFTCTSNIQIKNQQLVYITIIHCN